MKHNNVIQNNHFKKDWQNRVRTWFNQAARKERRRDNRIKKAAAVAPRPVGLLRPAVRGSTIKYNTKIRAGRGFTLEELKEAGFNPRQARSIGLSVDHRRKNRTVDSLQINTQRLKEYKAKLVVFPTKNGKPVKGSLDSAADVCAKASQQNLSASIPIRATIVKTKARKITDAERKDHVYATLRLARQNARMVGIRKKRAEDEAVKAKEAALTKAR